MSRVLIRLALIGSMAQGAPITWHAFNQPHRPFCRNPALSPARNELLAGDVQDTINQAIAKPQRLTLKGLTPGRRYQLQLRVADNRTFVNCDPAFASGALTVQDSSGDVNVPATQTT